MSVTSCQSIINWPLSGSSCSCPLIIFVCHPVTIHLGHPTKHGSSQRSESAFGSLQSGATSETLKGSLSLAPLDRSRVSVIIEQSASLARSQQNSTQKKVLQLIDLSVVIWRPACLRWASTPLFAKITTAPTRVRLSTFLIVIFQQAC